MYKSSLGSGYVVASSTKVALGRFWSTLISTSPAVRKNRSKSRRKKKRRRRRRRKRKMATLRKRRCRAVKKFFNRTPLVMPHSQGTDSAFLGSLRESKPLRHSQRRSLRLPSIQEQLDPCSSFPVSFFLVENVSLSFPSQSNQLLFIKLNWRPCFPEPGTTLFHFLWPFFL